MFDLDAYQSSLNTFESQIEKFKGTTSPITSTSSFTATTSTAANLERALKASKIALDRSSNPLKTKHQYTYHHSQHQNNHSRHQDNQSFAIPTSRHSSPESNPHHHRIPKSPLRSFDLDSLDDGIDARRLIEQEHVAGEFIKKIQLKELRELLQSKEMELDNCQHENKTLKMSNREANTEIEQLKKQLSQTMEINRQMRTQLKDYEESATKKALASIDQNMDTWKKSLDSQ